MNQSIVRRFAELETYQPPHHSGTTNRRLLSGGELATDLSMVRGTLLPGHGADYHLHHHSDQVIFVISGTCRVTVGTEETDLGADDTMVLPRGIPHGVEVTGDAPLQLHITYAPALRPGDTVAATRAPRSA